jgi:hypothetical protein
MLQNIHLDELQLAGGSCGSPADSFEGMMTSRHDYDLLVIGSGPAGHRAAIQGAKLDKRVAVVEKQTVVGGVCINTGTIPSKTLREAALRLSGYRERGMYGASYSVKQHITMRDLLFRVDHVISNEIDVARHQMIRNGVEILTARATFVDTHRLRLELPDGIRQEASASNIIIAVGTTTVHDPFARRSSTTCARTARSCTWGRPCPPSRRTTTTTVTMSACTSRAASRSSPTKCSTASAAAARPTGSVSRPRDSSPMTAAGFA